MARPRSATYDDQREQILSAAAALFARRGYTAATMNDVAAACGVSKATLYHYVRDKHDLLAQITAGHVARLENLVADVRVLKLAPEAHLRELIQRFMRTYAFAEHEHRVLTEDVKFLADEERNAVLAAQRRVVRAFAGAVAALRPELHEQRLDTPLAMLLFGMINWTFTWLKSAPRPAEPAARRGGTSKVAEPHLLMTSGALTHETLAPLVMDLFLGGLSAVQRVA